MGRYIAIPVEYIYGPYLIEKVPLMGVDAWRWCKKSNGERVDTQEYPSKDCCILAIDEYELELENDILDYVTSPPPQCELPPFINLDDAFDRCEFINRTNCVQTDVRLALLTLLRLIDHVTEKLNKEIKSV